MSSLRGAKRPGNPEIMDASRHWIASLRRTGMCKCCERRMRKSGRRTGMCKWLCTPFGRCERALTASSAACSRRGLPPPSMESSAACSRRGLPPPSMESCLPRHLCIHAHRRMRKSSRLRCVRSLCSPQLGNRSAPPGMRHRATHPRRQRVARRRSPCGGFLQCTDKLSRTTTPPFITKPTCSRVLTSCRGSPRTATRSA